MWRSANTLVGCDGLAADTAGALRQRVSSAALLVPVVVAVYLLGTAWIVASLGLVAVFGGREAFELLRRAGYLNEPVVGTVLALALVWASVLPGGGLERTLPVAGAIVLTGVAAFVPRDPRDGLQMWLGTLFGAAYVGLLGFVVQLALVTAGLGGDAPIAGLGAGRAWLLVLVLGVWCYDSGAYLAGTRWGRRRFLQHISPSKTYAGLIGGAIAATAMSALAMWALGRSPLEALVVGPLLALAAQAGDLAESLLKRAAGVKDSGQLIPGHGGMLDRIDSFLFAGPALVFYVALITR